MHSFVEKVETPELFFCLPQKSLLLLAAFVVSTMGESCCTTANSTAPPPSPDQSLCVVTVNPSWILRECPATVACKNFTCNLETDTASVSTRYFQACYNDSMYEFARAEASINGYQCFSSGTYLFSNTWLALIGSSFVMWSSLYQ